MKSYLRYCYAGDCICVSKFKVGRCRLMSMISWNLIIFSRDIFNRLFSVECRSYFCPSQANMADFEVITFNVKGLGSFKNPEVFNYL